MMLVKSQGLIPKQNNLDFFLSLARCIKRASYLLKEFIILKGIHEG